MGNLVSYRIRAKWFLTSAALTDAIVSISEKEGDYLSDVADLAELGATVGAIWYGEAVLGYAISNPLTGAVVAIVVTGAVVSYGIDGWTGVANFADYLEDIYSLDFKELGDKASFTVNVLTVKVATEISELPEKLQTITDTYETPEPWMPQPIMPPITGLDYSIPYLPGGVNPIARLINKFL